MRREGILYSEEGSIAILTLNRVERANALTQDMLDQLQDDLAATAKDDRIRVVVLTGGDRVFCAGLDLHVYRQADTHSDVLTHTEQLRKVLLAIENHPKPIVAVIFGGSLAGGLDLAMACDLRVAAESSRFGIAGARIGTVPTSGETGRLATMIGASKAKEMLLVAEPITGHQAEAIGLVNRLFADDDAFEEGMKLAGQISLHAPKSLAWLKFAINKGIQRHDDEVLDVESQAIADVWPTADRKEGLQAALEKRSPNFTGY